MKHSMMICRECGDTFYAEHDNRSSRATESVTECRNCGGDDVEQAAGSGKVCLRDLDWQETFMSDSFPALAF